MGLKYYADMKDALLYDLLRQASSKTENQLMVICYYSWKDFSDTSISTVAYNICDQVGTIGHGTHVPGPVS